MSFKPPGPAEVLRADQKDKDFIQRIQQELTDLIQQIFGQRFWLEWRYWLEYAPSLIYYSLTNLAGFQTLGEEYAGIVQVDSTFRKIPTHKRIAVMILLQVFGKIFFQKSLKRVKVVLSTEPTEFLSSKSTSIAILQPQPQINEESDGNFTKKWLRIIGVKLIEGITFCLPFMTQLHLTLFFFNGSFYHLSKRLTGIHYILVRKWFANQTQQNLQYLMWLSVFNLILSILHESSAFIVARRENSIVDINSKSPSSTSNELMKNTQAQQETTTREEENANANKKCSLCLEIRQNPSVTPCGHLFCWECILDWLRTKYECPICREQVKPSRVVPLQNYL